MIRKKEASFFFLFKRLEFWCGSKANKIDIKLFWIIILNPNRDISFHCRKHKKAFTFIYIYLEKYYKVKGKRWIKHFTKNFKRILFYHLSNDETQLIPWKEIENFKRQTVKRERPKLEEPWKSEFRRNSSMNILLSVDDIIHPSLGFVVIPNVRFRDKSSTRTIFILY